MTERIHCQTCRAAFLTPDDQPGQPVDCPKCGARQEPVTAGAPAATPEASLFVPSEDARPRLGRRLAWAAVVALTLAVVAVAVAWPALRERSRPVPPDPVTSVATAYLQALIDGDAEAAHRLGTVDLPPAIRTFRAVRHDPARDGQLKGSFAPLAAFHARNDEAYEYDTATGRYTPRNPLGPAAETLDALHEAKAKAEKDGLYKKMQSGDPNDVFDAAEGLARSISILSEGVLAPKKLIPSYRQLVDDARPPLPPSVRDLAIDYADHRESWDALLKRPFTALKVDGPFVRERAEVTASVIDALGSSGDPPTTLRLTLTRFRLEGIDTDWKVTSARREGPSADAR